MLDEMMLTEDDDLEIAVGLLIELVIETIGVVPDRWVLPVSAVVGAGIVVLPPG